MSTTAPAPERPQVDPSVLADITQAADHAYEALADRYEVPVSEVHRDSLCLGASKLMVRHLDGEYGKYNADVEMRGSRSVGGHAYVTFQAGRKKDLVADPTWQQFIDQDMVTPETPKLLIGNRSHVINVLRSHGIDNDDTLALWRKR